MDNSGMVPPAVAYYLPPLRGRAAPVGLQGATTADIRRGGMPERIGSFGPTGDLLEVDVPNPITPSSAHGDGPTYSPHPYLPTAQHLDYFHKLTSTGLLVIGLTLVLLLLVKHPRSASGLLARGGLKQAGIA